MAITLSAATDKKYLGAGNTPRVVEFLVSGTAAESGDIDLTHSEGRAADKVTFVQKSGSVQLYEWKRGSDTTSKSVVTLGTVPGGGSVGYAYLHFFGNDSPDVTE